MAESTLRFPIEHNAAIPTWFGVGGRADRLATPGSIDELRQLVRIDPDLRLLGEGANLLVADEGVGELVVRLSQGDFNAWSIDEMATVRAPDGFVIIMAGAGIDLRKLVTQTMKLGLSGLERLGGIPASLGGALVMNAGGVFGSISDLVLGVIVMDRQGNVDVLDYEQLGYGYRTSVLGSDQPGREGLIVIGCHLVLAPDTPSAIRQRFKEVMLHKKHTQPMGEKSAGCCFKNPLLEHDIDSLAQSGDDPELGRAGTRVSAGLLIDRAGCKGLSVGGARVSEQHANFFPVQPDAKAAHVIELMKQVQTRVFDCFGIRLEREVVIWRRREQDELEESD